MIGVARRADEFPPDGQGSKGSGAESGHLGIRNPLFYASLGADAWRRPRVRFTEVHSFVKVSKTSGDS